MKLVMDEKFKHRLVGIAVILSIGAIFAPAVMKKSNQRFESQIHTSVKLPPKPVFPEVAIPKKKIMFEKVKVARVPIPSINEKFQPKTTIAKAESISQMNDAKMATVLAKASSLPPIKEKKVVITPTAKLIKPLTKLNTPSTNRIAYGVQLATFNKQSNAVSLVNLLKRKGYKSKLIAVNHKNNKVYKVIVGQVDEKKQAQILQQQLALSTQIKGFVVPTQQG
jgi:DedD protein